MATGKMAEKEESKATAEMSEEEARKVLEAAKMRGMERCRAKIQMALQEEGYVLKGVPGWVEGSTGWNLVINIQLVPAE